MGGREFWFFLLRRWTEICKGPARINALIAQAIIRFVAVDRDYFEGRDGVIALIVSSSSVP